MRKILASLVGVVALASPIGISSASASAATVHPTYALGHAKSCRVDYVKRTERHVVRVPVRIRETVKGHLRTVVRVERKTERYVACVYVARRATLSVAPISTATVQSATPTGTATTTTTAAVTPTYTAKVDPSFTQSTTNPLDITYSYSASSDETPLPAGILNFYSPITPFGQSSLQCSMNVGGSTSGGTCEVIYAATGTYQVTTQYVPNGVSAVTETDTETIAPFTTTISVANVSELTSSGNGTGHAVYSIVPIVTDQNGNVVNVPAGSLSYSLETSGGVVFDAFSPSTATSCEGYPSSFSNLIVLTDTGGVSSDNLIWPCGGVSAWVDEGHTSDSIVATFTGAPGYEASSATATGALTP